MAKQKLTGAAYWRMSTLKQEESIGRQKAEMLPKCKLEGIELVPSVDAFEDEGQSGNDLERDAFNRLIEFCERRHRAGKPLDCVVCFDVSRFSRATSIETASYLHRLQRAGVYRIFTYKRWIDLRKREDRAILMLEQDLTNNAFSTDHSLRVLTGQKRAAEAGFSAGGATPYSFDRLLVDRRGRELRRIPRGQKIGFKDEGLRIELAPIPADDADPDRALERATAAWLFETFEGTDTNFRSLARTLNDRGVPGPGQHVMARRRKKLARKRRSEEPQRALWTGGAIRDILTNPIYAGLRRWGQVGGGKHYRVVSGKIEEADPDARPTYNEAGLSLVPLRHGGIISIELWKAVQAKIKARGNDKPRRKATGYVLSGLARCGHCGGRLFGETRRTSRNGHNYVYHMLVCVSYKHSPGSCRPFAISHDKLLKLLVRKLQMTYLSAERLEGLRRACREDLESRRAGSPTRGAKLREKLAALDEEIAVARRNLLRVRDDRTFVELNEELGRWLKRRERFQKELEAQEQIQAVPAAEVTRKVDEALARLEQLRQRLRDANPEQLAAVVRLLVSDVQLFFTSTAKAKHTWYKFTRGTIKFRPVIESRADSVNECRSTG